jgi:hypothetical protein
MVCSYQRSSPSVHAAPRNGSVTPVNAVVPVLARNVKQVGLPGVRAHESMSARESQRPVNVEHSDGSAGITVSPQPRQAAMSRQTTVTVTLYACATRERIQRRPWRWWCAWYRAGVVVV